VSSFVCQYRVTMAGSVVTPRLMSLTLAARKKRCNNEQCVADLVIDVHKAQVMATCNDKKLSYRREAARCLVLLSILVSR